jgi:hypothetical protein
MLAIFDEYMEFMEVLEKRRTKPYFLGAVNFRVNHFKGRAGKIFWPSSNRLVAFLIILEKQVKTGILL